MANIYKNNKATFHVGNAGITVYGDAAKIIEGITIATVSIIAIALISKALK